MDALVRGLGGKWFDGLEVRKAEERRKEQDVDVAGCCGEENESTLHFMLSGSGAGYALYQEQINMEVDSVDSVDSVLMKRGQGQMGMQKSKRHQRCDLSAQSVNDDKRQRKAEASPTAESREQRNGKY